MAIIPQIALSQDQETRLLEELLRGDSEGSRVNHRTSQARGRGLDYRPMNIVELENYLETRVTTTVQGHFPHDWKEDAITHALLISLRERLRRIRLFGVRQPLELEWEIYKFHGPRESSYGDIGLLIRYALPGGGLVEGAGFLEAKLRGRDSTRFHQVHHEQVSRILARSPHTRLFLYDYNPVSVLSLAPETALGWGDRRGRQVSRPPHHSVASHAPVIPLQLAAAINHYDDTLYRFAYAFSHQFCYRYLNLHDLDFSEAAVAAVKGFPEHLGAPNIVMVIRAAALDHDLPEAYRPNDSVYGLLE